MNSGSSTEQKTLARWIKEDTKAFSLDSQDNFNSAVDTMITSFDKSLALLGFGEALHGGEEILKLRNRLFQRLVEKYGFSAIAIESSFPRAHLTNEYILGRGPKTYKELLDKGFGQGVGQLESNRELVEWMKEYNADSNHKTKLQFYGIDIPTGTNGIASPRQVIMFVLDYLSVSDGHDIKERRERIDKLIGDDAKWGNPFAIMNPNQSIALSSEASALRIETEDLIAELQSCRPELVQKTNQDAFTEALQYGVVARGLLNFHAAMANKTTYPKALGIRDALQADNLLYMVSREKDRGKVFVFAHNGHLKKGTSEWLQGSEKAVWWAAGSQLKERLGKSYAVIGTSVGVSEENGINKPEAGTLEERLIARPIRLIPTYQGKKFSQSELISLPFRTGSQKNFTYFPLNAQSFTDFDWLAVLNEVSYPRGGTPLQTWDTSSKE
ncbi:MAG TPA: erythromycin esterase family protein [Methylomirabilota bacterium]|nr:erythromycin esterase family protein [Methylomirabilota bacterium]